MPNWYVHMEVAKLVADKPFAWTFTRADLERRLRDPLLLTEPTGTLVQVA